MAWIINYIHISMDVVTHPWFNFNVGFSYYLLYDVKTISEYHITQFSPDNNQSPPSHYMVFDMTARPIHLSLPFNEQKEDAYS